MLPMASKSFRLVAALAVGALLLPIGACAKIPEGSDAAAEEVPLPQEIEDIDSSELVPTAEKQNCRKAPSIETAEKHTEYPLIGGGIVGTYDWAAGKTNGGQIWKTRLSYSRSNLAQVQIVPTYPQIGNVATQTKLAGKINAVSYVNGDFYNLRGTNLLFSAMVSNGELVYSPSTATPIVGVVESDGNDRTGLQGSSHILHNDNRKIETQGLNLQYLAADSIGAYNSLKSSKGLPPVTYVVEVKEGLVTKSGKRESFNIPTVDGDYVFAAAGLGAETLKSLRVGDQVEYVKPKGVKTTKFLRTEITPSGTVELPNGEILNIRAVNHRGVRINSGLVMFTSELYPSTSALSATLITDLSGRVTKVYATGRAINVAKDQLVFQVGSKSVAEVRKLKVGDKLMVTNSYKIKKDVPLFASFGNRQNMIINGVVVARCSPAWEDIRPRNAIGWNENGDVWFANTTMGVRNSADVFNRFRLGGSSVHQLATWLKEVGATQAVMLDGGGSTTMYRLTETGSYKRVELPASEWVRVVPQGLGMVQR